MTLAIASAVLPLLAAAPQPRGHPASRLPDTDEATEYWDVVARFDSQHALFARFMITNEGPGERTATAYGHVIEPDGTTRFFSNGRRQGHWQLGAQGLRLQVGSSLLDLTGPEVALRVHKQKKGVDIDLRFTPDGPFWGAASPAGVPPVDLLAVAAPISGHYWFRGMEAPVALSGRVGLSHTWMRRSEPDVALRRTDFFSLQGGPAVYLRDFEAPDGTRARWLAVAEHGEILFQTNDFAVSETGRAAAQRDAGYPLPATLGIRGPKLSGRIQIGAGLLHHDPMEVMPQPFRFLLSFKMRPHRVWADSAFEVTYQNGSEAVKIRGTGIATVTFLNPIPPKTSLASPPCRGV